MRYLGIDISKDTFMVAYPEGKGFRTESFKNTDEGITSFMKGLTSGEDHCVMEATGNYSINLLYKLLEGDIATSMINPRQSKYFAKMLLETVKTDERDACMLALYGEKIKPQVFKLPSDTVLKLKQKRTVLRQFHQQLTATKNVRDNLKVLPVKDNSSLKALDGTIEHLEKQIKSIEKEMVDITSSEFKDQMDRLQTIKGIGATVAAALIITTSCFSGFSNAKQVSRYYGLCPTYQQSGTSVHFNGHISHGGDCYMRGLLYVASWSAIRYNKACKEFYEHLLANGKSKKEALVAVSNKLVRQAFALIKNGTVYVDGFISVPPCKN